MKLWVTAIGVGFLMALAGQTQVLAHTEATDGKISGLLHIDPNDAAKAGQINAIHIYFNDKDGRFTMEGCDCKIKISQDNKKLLDGQLDTAEVKTGTAQVFLPDNNSSYDVVVSGSPKTAGFFQPFKLAFKIDVGNPPADEPEAEDGPNLLVRAVGSIVIVAVVAGAYSILHKRIKMKM